MQQSAAVRPDPTTQRKAAIARGAALEHTGKVLIEPIPNFDLNRTIFKTLEGKAARFVMNARVGKQARWDAAATEAVQAEYAAARAEHPLPGVSTELMDFLVSECDFNVEHADGSFLDHLYFCFEYTVQHYPQRSPVVMLLHSILGTGTNTFAMTADKIPALRLLMTPWEWTQVQAFPSVLRLLYAGPLREELRKNVHRTDAIACISFHRVIDNAPITLSGEDFWIALNYQLIHLIDFLPAANWSMYRVSRETWRVADLSCSMRRICGLTTRAHCGLGPMRWRRRLNMPVSGQARPPCVPIACTWPAARCVSNAAGCLSTSCWRLGQKPDLSTRPCRVAGQSIRFAGTICTRVACRVQA